MDNFEYLTAVAAVLDLTDELPDQLPAEVEDALYPYIFEYDLMEG